MSNMSGLVEVQSLNNDELISFLTKNGLSEFTDVIRAKVYDGHKLLNLTEFEIQLWRPKKTQQQMQRFWAFLMDLKSNPERYLAEEEEDEIYENYREEHENQADIFKRNVSELCNDERSLNELKTVLQQKEQEFVSSNSFDSDDDEIYMNENVTLVPQRGGNVKLVPPPPPKPVVSPKTKPKPTVKVPEFVSSDSFDSDDDDIYMNENVTLVPQRGGNVKLVPPPPPKPVVSPKTQPKPTVKVPTSKVTIEVCNKIEETLKRELFKTQSKPGIFSRSPKNNPEQNLKIPKRSTMIEDQSKAALPNPIPKSPRKSPDEDSNVPKLPAKFKSQGKAPLPTLEPQDTDDDEDMPEYLDIDEEELEQEPPPQKIAEDPPKMKPKSKYDNIKQRPLPPLPTSEPDEAINPIGIQKVPLPPIPSKFSSLPRPPKSLIDLGTIQNVDLEDIEDFNFEQNFVSKYSSANFYRYTDRRGSEQLLLRPNIRNGTFLVRPSTNHYCTVSVRYNDKVYQLALHKGRGTKVVQADTSYESIEAYIEQHKVEPLYLPCKDGYRNVYLTDVPPRD